MLSIGSLFSGAGGLDMAVEQVFGGKVSWQCELEILHDEKGHPRMNPAGKVLRHRFPDAPNLGDITSVNWAAIPPVDVLCGGFPCQDVSAAGRRAGLGPETRSGLWAMYANAIAALRPKFVVIENVRGLLSAEAHRGVESADATVGDGAGGSALRAAGAVLGDLADLGYDAQWATVSAASVGAPHQRERVFMLAHPADAEGYGRQRLNDGASGKAARSRRQWLVSGGAGKPSSSDAASDGWDQGRAESEGIGGRPDVAQRSDADVALLPTPKSTDHKRNDSPSEHSRKSPALGAIEHYLPTPAAADAERGPDFARAARDGSGGDDLVTLCARATREIGSNWGRYEPSIRRWEYLTRPAPSPTEPNTKGNPRLAPAFPEWMMGWPVGWVTDVPGISRNDQLRIIGNGVCPQQAVAALHQLLPVIGCAA
ncbi:DNA cytosine methyltransferase [Mycolicibacterium fluoranthenivorans]|uniref:DNA (cytosine-5-)-methyltransferase n=1 Tax=Mycolicibacterium fluoranthenivorans TaxID=258505 RepID=A0A7X5U5R6_9MYCO|nr:DNA cytosine methyltransferase [Mycolicibacterium fluoranthenivorans]MCV7359172.1 DNA cytosine methyltransferase [Mycolicibacterium fluoranthenivorans]NIH98941.1 DNA (cytosine-5)-methyltransferase 1 [Mycolicibacterium fluoranthenivorans]